MLTPYIDWSSAKRTQWYKSNAKNRLIHAFNCESGPAVNGFTVYNVDGRACEEAGRRKAMSGSLCCRSVCMALEARATNAKTWRHLTRLITICEQHL